MKDFQEAIKHLNFQKNESNDWQVKIVSELKKNGISHSIETRNFYTADDLFTLKIKDIVRTQIIKSSILEKQWGPIIDVTNAEKTRQEVQRAVENGANNITYKILDGRIKEDDIISLCKDLVSQKCRISFDVNNLSEELGNSIFGEHLLHFFEAENITFSFIINPIRFSGKKSALLNNLVSTSAGINIDGRGHSIHQVLSYTTDLIHLFSAEPSHILDRIQFMLPVGKSYFYELAKFRAFRYLWEQIKFIYLNRKENNPTRIGAFIFDCGEDCKPYEYLLHETSRMISAAMGGCSTFLIPFIPKLENQYSEAMLNVPVILFDEAHINTAADPAGGSYYIESLTQNIVAHEWNAFKRIVTNEPYS
jgi:hypothetical protein